MLVSEKIIIVIIDNLITLQQKNIIEGNFNFSFMFCARRFSLIVFWIRDGYEIDVWILYFRVKLTNANFKMAAMSPLAKRIKWKTDLLAPEFKASDEYNFNKLDFMSTGIMILFDWNKYFIFNVSCFSNNISLNLFHSDSLFFSFHFCKYCPLKFWFFYYQYETDYTGLPKKLL